MAGLPDPVVGAVVGTAVADALGLPLEGLSPQRARRLFPGQLRQRLLFGRGMVSDDTEHTWMVLRSLQESPHDAEEFQRRFARRLRLWLMTVPAGAGLATVKATLRLMVGVPPSRSGVMSAGNGAAMRAAVIGAWFCDDPDQRVRFVQAASVVTHRDQRAIEGAQLVALAAAASAKNDLAIFDAAAPEFQTHTAWSEPLDLERGVSGYVISTVHAALQVWLEHPRDYRTAVAKAIALGGDTDTVGAIVGGIVGAGVGEGGIPSEWMDGLWEWPRGIAWMRNPGPYAWPLVPLRNVIFLATVLAHGLRRLGPPY